jgi:hypothetical protein
MAEKPAVYTPEVAERLHALVMDLENDVYELEDASRVTLDLAMGLDDRSQIPDDLIEDGLNFIAADLVRRTMALKQRYAELFALAVRQVLPENDPDCQKRKEPRGLKLKLNLGASAG